MKSYKPDENSRAIAFKELIGKKDISEFAEKFGLSVDGVIKYGDGTAPISKAVGRRLSVKLKLPFNYFEEAKPGDKNNYNSKNDYNPEKAGITRALILKELVGTNDHSVFAQKFSINSIRASRYIQNSEPMSEDTGKVIARLLGLQPRFFDNAAPGGKDVLFHKERLEKQISKLDQSQISNSSCALPSEDITVPTRQKSSTPSSHANLNFLNSLPTSIGSRLQKERLRLKLRRPTMAKILSATSFEQASYETGAEIIPATYLSLAASILGVDVVYVLTAKRM